MIPDVPLSYNLKQTCSSNLPECNILLSFTQSCSLFLGNFRALSHNIFGNFIFLCWLWAFKLQTEEKYLFGWQNCHLHTTTDDSRASHIRTTWNKLVLQIYLNAISCSVLPNRVPFGISFFLFCSFRFSSSNTSIFSESIFWSSGKYRNCLIDLIVWDRSTGAPYKVIIFVCLFIAVTSLHVRYVNGIPESEKQFACGMRNRGIWNP